MLCFSIFTVAAKPTSDQIGAGCATAMAGKPDDALIRIHFIICKIGLQLVIDLQGGFAETFMLVACSKMEIAEPFCIGGSSLDGDTVDSVGFVINGVQNISPRDGISYIVAIVKG